MRRRQYLTIALACAAMLLAGCGSASHSTTRRASASSASVRLTTPNPATSQFVDYRPADLAAINPLQSGTIVASDGFELDRDGFSFANYGFVAGPELSVADMRELFGNGVCAGTPSNSCTLVPTAEQFDQQVDDDMIGGHCFGFSMTALRFFKHLISPSQFGGPTTYSLHFSPALESTIAFDWALQELKTVQNSAIKLTPDQDISFLEKALPNKNGPVYTIGIHGSDGGHAVTPIAVQNDGGGHYAIDIYDNNYPGTPRAISINTNTDSWSYNLAPPGQSSEVWSGQGNTNPIELFPLPSGLGNAGAQPCGSACSNAPAGTPISISLAGDPDTHGHLLITNARGQHIGYLHGRFVDNMAGARAFIPLLDEDWLAHPEPLYQVPSGGKLSITLNGNGAVGQEAATVNVSGVGYGAHIFNLRPQPGEDEQIGLSSSGTTLSLKQTGSAPASTPTVEMLVDHGRGGSEFSATARALHSGTALSLTISPATGQLHLSSTGSSASLPLSLKLNQIAGSGVQTIKTGAVKLKSGQAKNLSFSLTTVGS